MKGLFDKFLIPFTEGTDDEDRENKDSVSQGSKFDGNRTKGKKQVQKDKKSTKEENDCRVQNAVEETQEVLDTMSQTEENPDDLVETYCTVKSELFQALHGIFWEKLTTWVQYERTELIQNVSRTGYAA
eukprot:g47333.t1